MIRYGYSLGYGRGRLKGIHEERTALRYHSLIPCALN